MSLWDTITANSSLPVQPGNNLWDHLNNQAGAIVFVGPTLIAEINQKNTAENINNSVDANTSIVVASADSSQASSTVINQVTLEADIKCLN